MQVFLKSFLPKKERGSWNTNPRRTDNRLDNPTQLTDVNQSPKRTDLWGTQRRLNSFAQELSQNSQTS